MKLSKKEIAILGKAYDALKHSFIVLDSSLGIRYLNNYAKKLFGFTDQEIEEVAFFNLLLKKHNYPPLFADKEKFILNHEPMKIKKHLKKWELVRGTVNRKEAIFLFDKDVTEQEEMYEVLSRSVSEVTGQVFSKRLSAQEYMDEIRGCLENVIRQMPCYVYWKDKEFRYIFCNEITAEIMGLSSAEAAVGKTDYDFGWDNTLVDSYRETDTKILTTGEPILNLEEDLIDKNGRVYHTLVNKIPLKNHQGQIIGLLGITVDVTGVRKAEIAKANFIANMSHDIRTPLTGIIGMAKLLEEKVITEEEKQFAGWVYESGQQLLKLLNGVLDLVSADHLTEDDLHKDNFDIRQAINDIINLEKPTLFHKNLECNLVVEKDVPIYIKSDRFKLSRIILNLVGNAIKFTDKGSINIHVRCPEKNTIEFSIADTGKGIPKPLLPKIFERFYRVSPSYKGDHTGHGLGLHIVEKFLDLLGGNIHVTSVEHKGTVFTFTVPFLPVDSLENRAANDFLVSLQNAPAASTTNPANQKNTVISEKLYDLLIVEDNDIALRIAENLCIQQGCNVTTAVTGEAALEQVKNKKFHLILTDLGLPGISGNEFTKELRSLEKQQNITAVPIIGLTAHASDEAKTESLNAGMNELFGKPLQANLLQKILDKYAVNQTSSSSTPWSNEESGLPQAEEELFTLDKFPLLDTETGIHNLGCETIFKDILISMVDEELPKGLEKLKLAYSNKDWTKIASLAHQMKSGAVYCGTSRLKQACQYLERYRKVGYEKDLEKLYQQLMHVAEQTVVSVKSWLYNQ